MNDIIFSDLANRVKPARLVLSTAIAAALFIGFLRFHAILTHPHLLPLIASIEPKQILADGHDTAQIESDPRASRITIVEGAHRASAGEDGKIRAGVNPGHVVFKIESPGYFARTVELETTLQTTDRYGDGTPDFLRLDDDHDRLAFRRWFTFLAEAQYFQPPQSRPAGINDCAALIRYAYREALRNHDSTWSAGAQLPMIPALESIAKYEYPFTPIGPSLFRVRYGPFRTTDLSDGTFAQFADAQTLQRLNTHFVTRDLPRAKPGDLLFFRHVSSHMPFHSMIFLGRSQIDRSETLYLLYHTGPTGSDPGEIRRLTVQELLHFPEPQWRPEPSNPSFLGIHRWNILGRD